MANPLKVIGAGVEWARLFGEKTMSKPKKTALIVAGVMFLAVGVAAVVCFLSNDLDAGEQELLNRFKTEKGKACTSVVLFAKGRDWEINPDSVFVSQILDALPGRMILQRPDTAPPQRRLSVAPDSTIRLVSKSGGEISLRLYQGPVDVLIFDGKKRDPEGSEVWRSFSPNGFFSGGIADVVKARRGLDWDVPTGAPSTAKEEP